MKIEIHCDGSSDGSTGGIGGWEVWHIVQQGYYQVSSLGRVRRAKPGLSHNCLVGRVLTPILHNKGYLHVSLCIERKKRLVPIHQLVAEGFLGPCPEGMCVNHIDGDKLNNRNSNLEYVTTQGNARHAAASGLLATGYKWRRSNKRKLNYELARQIRCDNATGQYKRKELGAKYGVSPELIKQIVDFKVWKELP